MSIQKKYWFLILGFILLLFLAYKFSFSKTLDELHKNKTLINNQDLLNSIESNLLNIKQQDLYYSKLLEKHQFNIKGSFQNNLLKFLTSYSKENNLTIINFGDPHSIIQEKSIQENYLIEIQGDFISIVNLIYQLEASKKFGKIISCNFEKKKNYRTKRNQLFCKLYLQRIVQL